MDESDTPSCHSSGPQVIFTLNDCAEKLWEMWIVLLIGQVFQEWRGDSDIVWIEKRRNNIPLSPLSVKNIHVRNLVLSWGEHVRNWVLSWGEHVRNWVALLGRACQKLGALLGRTLARLQWQHQHQFFWGGGGKGGQEEFFLGGGVKKMGITLE